MKKAKFLISQLIIAVFLVFLLGSPALAEKPTTKGGGGSCSVKKVKGVCPDDTGSTDDGSTDGTDGPCPEGMKWLDLFQMCIIA